MPPLVLGWRPRLSLGAVMTSLLMTSLDAHSYGADRKACDDMTPQHETRPRTDSPPFYIRLSNTTYIPGVPIEVSLIAYSGNSYKGFLIQARVTETTKQVGTFNPIGGTKRICDLDVGLTHTDANPKTSMTFDWNPPGTLEGSVQFKATVVESQYTYWVAIPSQVINEGQTTTAAATTTITPITSSTKPSSPPTTSSVTSSSASPEIQTQDTEGSTMETTTNSTAVGAGVCVTPSGWLTSVILGLVSLSQIHGVCWG